MRIILHNLAVFYALIIWIEYFKKKRCQKKLKNANFLI